MERLLKIFVGVLFAIGIGSLSWGMDSSNDVNVEVFDVGHGNCVLVTYKDQGLMVDAGSKGLPLNALYDDMFGKKEILHIVEGITTKEDCYDWDDNLCLSPISISTSFSSDGDDTLQTDLPPVKQTYKLANDYKNHQVKEIQRHLYDLKIVKIIVSHSHEDHYNWLCSIFEPDDLKKKIGLIILGGINKCYKDTSVNKFSKWIESVKERQKTKVPIVFTGETSERKLCKAFSSLMPPQKWSKRNGIIMEALKFIGDSAPEVQVLAMNAGCSTGTLKEYLCQYPNVNSIVLRIAVQGGKSLILPGDATGATWEFIESNLYGKSIKSNYLLLSHHGASSLGETNERMLKMVQPELFILSAGCHQQYKSPSEDTINMMSDCPSVISVPNQKWPLSCYNSLGVKSVIECGKKFGSTLDDGLISFSLADTGLVNLEPSRCRQNQFDKVFLQDKGWVKNVISYRATEIGNVNNNLVKFYKCSPRSNVLVLNSSYNATGSSIALYMYDLTTKLFYKLESID